MIINFEVAITEMIISWTNTCPSWDEKEKFFAKKNQNLFFIKVPLMYNLILTSNVQHRAQQLMVLLNPNPL